MIKTILFFTCFIFLASYTGNAVLSLVLALFIPAAIIRR